MYVYGKLNFKRKIENVFFLIKEMKIWCLIFILLKIGKGFLFGEDFINIKWLV